MDAVHAAWDRCPATERKRYTGKEGYPTIVWNVSITAAKKIIYVSGPFAGADPDKTIVKFDDFALRVRDDPEFKDRSVPVLTGSDGSTTCAPSSLSLTSC